MSSSDEETFDCLQFKEIQLTGADGTKLEVSGDAAGTYRWDGANLPPVHEAGSGGLKLEPEEGRFPADILVTGLTEAKATNRQTGEKVALSEEEERALVEVLNNHPGVQEDFYTQLQEDPY